ncbi:MerR family transcriptional regulator [Oscillospiraceae bacterium]|nr:MerR family transcriptional regulator [Oscillospiraceae bacterium]
MMTIHEVSKLAGVSVRTLHHYDAIGLLPPTRLTDAGYRLYDDTALARLQSILLFRELEFPLKEIKRILDDPGFDQSAALADQIKLLELRRKQLGKLIALARETLKTGVTPMKFDAFDKTEQKRFAAEAKEKWGGTAAYQEYQQREQDGTTGDPADLMAQFAALGKLKELAPAAPEVQAAIRDLQQFITDHFYTCTPEILAGLGEMYVADDRFHQNIDKVGGEGTAEFVAQAIRAYCGN